MRCSAALVLIAVIPVLSLLAACGASGGEDGAGADDQVTTATAASSDDETTDSTTDEPVGDETTTTAAPDEGDGGDGPTSAALAELLPAAEEVGPGYRVSAEDLDDTDQGTDDSSDQSDPTDDAIVEACPGTKYLDELDTGAASPTEVSREYATDTDQTIEVALDPDAGDFTEDTVDKIVDALADCETINTTDEDGNKITMDLAAERNDDYGDYGLGMRMTASFEYEGVPFEVEFRGQIFSLDGVTVSVVATSGLDDASYDVVPGDYAKVPVLAAEMAERVGAL